MYFKFIEGCLGSLAGVEIRRRRLLKTAPRLRLENELNGMQNRGSAMPGRLKSKSDPAFYGQKAGIIPLPAYVTAQLGFRPDAWG
jgi:hypothetical protein